MADGYITIETKLSTDKFDKQIINLEKKIKDEENKSELKLKAKLQAEDELKRHKQAIFEIEKEYEKTSQQVEHLQSIMSKQSQGISLTPQEFTDLQGSEKVIANNEKIGETLDRMYAKEVKLNNAVDRTTLAYKQIQGNVQGYKSKIESIKLQKHQAQVNNIKDGFDKMNKSVGNSIKHIGRLALGIISVASAYRLMSAASSTLAQYDEQYGANLEYIRYALAQSIAPILRYLVDLAGKLLGYLNYILNAWFGINLFANATASSMNKGANATAKMKKQLAGFDEMNVLNDNGSVGSVLPSMDLSQIQGDVPKWLEWIAGNGILVRKIILGIVSALAGLKLAKIASVIGLIGEKWLWLRGLGIGVAIYGIISFVKDLTSYIDKFDESLENNGTTFEDFGKIVKDVGLIVLGIGTAFLSLPAVITGACIAILGLIIKYRDQILNGLETAYNWLANMQENLVNWFIDNLDTIKENFGVVGVGIVTIVIGVVNYIIEIVKGAIEMIKHLIEGIATGFKQIFDGILMIFRGNFKKGFISIAKGIANIFIGIINAVISGINAIIYPIRGLVVEAGKISGKNWDMNTIKIPTIRYLKNGGIINLPSHGVPVGANAIGGEAGAEGVIPLTDSQAMETLGEAIGKYITINANIPVSMNGRVISRQLQQIRNDREFAYNG